MSRNEIDYSHNDVGSKPDNPLDFKKDGRPKAQYFDWFWYSVIQAINGHAQEFTRLDSDDDGIVDNSDKVGGWTVAEIKNWVNSSSSVPYAAKSTTTDSIKVVSERPSNPDDGEMWLIE